MNCSSKSLIKEYSNSELQQMSYHKEMTNEEFDKISVKAFELAGIKFIVDHLDKNVENLKESDMNPYAYESLVEVCEELGFVPTDYQKKKLELVESKYKFDPKPLSWYPWSF